MEQMFLQALPEQKPVLKLPEVSPAVWQRVRLGVDLFNQRVFFWREALDPTTLGFGEGEKTPLEGLFGSVKAGIAVLSLTPGILPSLGLALYPDAQEEEARQLKYAWLTQLE